MAAATDRYHKFHAEATALAGSIHLPLKQEIKPHAYVQIHEDGGYLAQQATEFQLESILAYSKAYTQVGGNLEQKPGHGWGTITTSVVEGLNILNVITADRVVAQVSTEHPLIGYIPKITFLGTQFVNLRIAGHPIELDLDCEFFGPKPANDAPYTKDEGFIGRICDQHDKICGTPGVPQEIAGKYNRTRDSFANPTHQPESVECSLISKVAGGYPGKTFGHVIHIPDFGTIYLAQVRLEHEDPHPESKIPQKTTIHLDMIHAKMGCIATGTAMVATTRTNGGTRP